MKDNVNKIPAVSDKYLACLRFPADFAELHSTENRTPINPIGQQQQRDANMLHAKKSGTSMRSAIY